MKQAKKILSGNGKQMLSARSAAERLSCAPDYIGKLCRDGKLSGTLVNGAWFVFGASLEAFESSRQEARAARSEELSVLRKQELSNNGFISRGGTSIAVSLFNPLLFKVAMASAAIGFIFFASVALTKVLSVSNPEPLSAALGQIQSPFFGAGRQTSIPFSIGGLGEYVLSLFSSDIRVQVTVRGPTELEIPANAWTMASTSVSDAVPVRESNTEVASNQQPQIIINPIIERTTERVLVENGISPALLSSIVKELAIGSDGAIQYSRGGSFSASSTALVWDNEQGALKVSGALNADSLCLQGVCLTKAQLQNLISTTTSKSTP